MTDANTDGARMVAACTSGDEATVRELLGETPSLARQVLVGPLATLHYAVREGHAGIVQLLLQHGADAHVVVEGAVWGIPLRTVDVAAARGFSEVVALIDKAILGLRHVDWRKPPLSAGPARRRAFRWLCLRWENTFRNERGALGHAMGKVHRLKSSVVHGIRRPSWAFS
jgi:Ankyrin repeat